MYKYEQDDQVTTEGVGDGLACGAGPMEPLHQAMEAEVERAIELDSMHLNPVRAGLVEKAV
ncbi:MAG: hypothetical protein JXB62_16165, partial [Pirellulales bacterium]|nr:hypothetical protein [Pirellulales bacterium]